MIDTVDRAQELEELQRADALATQRFELPKPGCGSEICDRCDGDIPAARSALGYRICIDCQQSAEHSHRGRRR